MCFQQLQRDMQIGVALFYTISSIFNYYYYYLFMYFFFFRNPAVIQRSLMRLSRHELFMRTDRQCWHFQCSQGRSNRVQILYSPFSVELSWMCFTYYARFSNNKFKQIHHSLSCSLTSSQNAWAGTRALASWSPRITTCATDSQNKVGYSTSQRQPFCVQVD